MAEYIDKIGAADLEGGVGTSVAADGLWNVKGDLAVATADNTAARLGVGTNGQVLIADSAETTGLRWGAGSSTTLPGLSDVADDVTTNPATRAAYTPSSTTPRDPGHWVMRHDILAGLWSALRGAVIDFLDYGPYLDGTNGPHNTAKWNQALKDLEDRGGGKLVMPGGWLQFAEGVNGLPAHCWADGDGWAGNQDSLGRTEGTNTIGTHLYYNKATHFIRGKSYGPGGSIFTVTGVSHAAGTSLATITTSASHGLVADDECQIASVAGAVGVNGTWRIVTAPTATTFTVRIGDPGTYTSGGTVQKCLDYEADMCRVSNMVIRGGPNSVGGSYDAIRLRNHPDNTTAASSHSYNDDVYHWVEHCWVYNWGGRGTYFTGTTSGGETWSRECYVTDSHYMLCGKYNATPVPAIEWATSSDGVALNCRVELTGNSGSTYIAGCDGIKLGGGNCAAIACKVWYSRGNGITLSSARCQAYSCESQDNLGHGFELGGDDPILMGFRADSNGSKDAGQPGPWFGVYVSAACTGGMVMGHVGNRGANGETDYGIGFSASNTSRDIVISISLGLDPKPQLCRPSDYAQLGRQFVDGSTRRVMQQAALVYAGNGTVVTTGVDLTARYVYHGQYRVEATVVTSKLNTSSPDPALRLECVEDTTTGVPTGTFTVDALSGWCVETGAAATGMAWNAVTGAPTPTALASGAVTAKRVFRLRGTISITGLRTDPNGLVGGIVRVAFGSNGNATTNTLTLEPGSELLLERIL